MKAVMFPGQGSQKIGMGEALFEPFSNELEVANDILGYDLKALCLEDEQGQLNHTAFTQPALFCVNHLHFLSYRQEHGDANVYLGHSLGEYNALVASGSLSFVDGLRLVKERGRLMGEVKNGGMSAIIGLDIDQIDLILSQDECDGIDIANINAPNQIVVSGVVDQLGRIEEKAKEAGAKMAIRLKVSGAFHSRYMKPVADVFASHIESFHFSTFNKPVIANINAQHYQEAFTAQNLIAQIYSSVRWVESIQGLISQGVDDFIEVGPGRILTGLLRHIQRT